MKSLTYAAFSRFNDTHRWRSSAQWIGVGSVPSRPAGELRPYRTGLTGDLCLATATPACSLRSSPAGHRQC